MPSSGLSERLAERSLSESSAPFGWKELRDDPRMFIIRRTGGRSGTADADTHVSSPTNYYLCRARDGFDRDAVIEWINGTEFPERDWSVGSRSLSKGEVFLRLGQNPLA